MDTQDTDVTEFNVPAGGSVAVVTANFLPETEQEDGILITFYEDTPLELYLDPHVEAYQAANVVTLVVGAQEEYLSTIYDVLGGI